MCGNELPASAYAHRFGALAVMSPSPSPSSSPRMPPAQLSLAGRVSFFNESDHDCHVATHVHFSPSGTVPACPLLLRIGSSSSFGSIALTLDPADEARSIRLAKPLHLHVGDDKDGNPGIIGHRITIQYGGVSEDRATALAEGIVGCNSLPRTEARCSRS